MSVSKYKLAEQCIKTLNGGEYTTDSKITLRQASYAVAQARNKLVRDLVWSNRNIGERNIPIDILSTYTVKSTKGSDGWYVSLPIRTLSTLHNDFSIFQVSLVGDFANNLIPVRDGFFTMYKGLGLDSMEGRNYYMAQRDRILIYGIEKEADFTLKLIADATEFSEREDLCIPAEMERDILNLSLELLQVEAQTPQDLINDNADNG